MGLIGKLVTMGIVKLATDAMRCVASRRIGTVVLVSMGIGAALPRVAMALWLATRNATGVLG
jgi:hypothetical protein